MRARRRAPDWLTKTTYAHRGKHTSSVPENSLPAAEGAIAGGFGIECDVQRSGERTAFVFHDWDLDRLTDASGAVGDRSDAELETFSLLGTQQTPITLARFLELVDGRVPLLIEIKSKLNFDVAPTCESVNSALMGYTGPCAVMSFDPRVLMWFNRHAPGPWLGLVGTDSLLNGFENVWRTSNLLERLKPDFLALDRRDLTNPLAIEWRASGSPLLTWTVRTAEQKFAAAALADALIAEGEALL